METHVSFHNRFDIELIRSGKTIQKGFAENIVLEKMYSKLCNYEPYFTNINFGKGNGTTLPSRTTLFNQLGSKAAATEEVIKAFPMSKWTKKIQLNPEEFAGETFTEVGISDSASYVLTHALIKDSEGNPLSITKTELDVLIIYATVFIELRDSGNIKFNKFISYNRSGYSISQVNGSNYGLYLNDLLNYFFGGVAVKSYAYLSSVRPTNYIGTTNVDDIIMNSTVTPDVPNRKIIYTGRVPVGTGNGKEISAIGLSGALIADISTQNTVEEMIIGTGDGAKTSFEISNGRIQNLTIKIEGSITTGYAINSIAGYKAIQVPFRYRWLKSVTSNPTAIYELPNKLYNGNKIYIIPSIGFDSTWLLMFSAVDGELVIHYLFRGGGDYDLKVTADGEYIKTGSSYSSVTYLKVNDDLTLTETTNPGTMITPPVSDYLSIQNSKICVVEPEAKYEIVFDTPPPQSATITADFSIPYFLKDENHILDYEIAIQFGEGV